MKESVERREMERVTEISREFINLSRKKNNYWVIYMFAPPNLQAFQIDP